MTNVIIVLSSKFSIFVTLGTWDQCNYCSVLPVLFISVGGDLGPMQLCSVLSF